jgi:hypothetical protein
MNMYNLSKQASGRSECLLLGLKTSLFMAALCLISGIQSSAAGGRPVTLIVDAQSMSTSSLSLGVTHGQFSADGAESASGAESARKILSATPLYQNQHIMGWGADNPEPAPGNFDWSSLDRRMSLIRATRGIPVITLCCAPDWMKGGPAGVTDWHSLTVAPRREHFSDFARLAAVIAARYPDVQYFLVWNEFKGFWSEQKNRWDYEGYTELYNQVFDAVRQAAPHAFVGGPYATVGLLKSGGTPSKLHGGYGIIDQRSLDAIDYWLGHNHGADFVVVDGITHPAGEQRISQYFSGTRLYADATSWLHSRTSLPIWWAEWYSADFTMADDLQNALGAASLIKMSSTVRVALRWNPQGDATNGNNGDQESLWTDTRVPGGGNAFPFAQTTIRYAKFFPPGTPLFVVHTSDDSIIGIASSTCIMVVNTIDRPQMIALERKLFPLAPFEVLSLARRNLAQC